LSDYTVTIVDEDQAEPESKTTADLEEALDWFTNAASEVMEGESEIVMASIAVDGKLWGLVREGGLEPPGEGEVIPLPRRTRAA
jgi:hypothetical protein